MQTGFSRENGLVKPKDPNEEETEYESEEVEVTTFNTLHEKKILEAEQLRIKVCSLKSQPQETKREYYAKLSQRQHTTLTEDTEQLMDSDRDLEDDFLHENPAEETLDAERIKSVETLYQGPYIRYNSNLHYVKASVEPLIYTNT